MNTLNEYSIGVLEEAQDSTETYRPLVLWNLKIESYVSDPDIAYRAYGCLLKIKSKQGGVKSFKIFIKEGDFNKFDKVWSAIVAQSHGELIMNKRFDHNLWAEFVPKLLFDSYDEIIHQCPARNIGLQWHYLVSKAFEKQGILQIDDVEIVYKDVGKVI